MVYVLFMTSPGPASTADLWQLLQRACPQERIQQLCREQGYTYRRGIYSILVVIWLMMYQRLNGKRSSSSAVHWLVRNAENLYGRNACKRVRMDNISGNNGAYCQARRKIPKLVTTLLMDSLFEELQQHMREVMPELTRPAFIADGTTLRTAHSKQLAEQFPPGHNQHGENHWPTLLLVTFHDAYTGLATRPSWGAMYGPEAVSEQCLAEQALQRLPGDAIVMGDGNFGIFAFAYAVQRSQRPMLLRLTLARARKVLGERALRAGRRRKVLWQPSPYERKMHRELPPECALQGWVMAYRNPAKSTEILYFYTTLDLKPARIVALYKLRWNIGVSSQGHIVQSVKDRPRPKDSGLVAGEESWRESNTAEPSDNILGKECAQRTRLQRTVNADVASLHDLRWLRRSITRESSKGWPKRVRYGSSHRRGISGDMV
jgi:hypothetical protein